MALKKSDGKGIATLLVSVHAELSLLYWQVGQRIHRDILGSQRAGYGEAVVPELAGREPERGCTVDLACLR